MNKKIDEIEKKRKHIDKVDLALKFADDIVHSKVPLNSSTKIKWQQFKKDIENYKFVYKQDMQMKFQEMIKIVDEILKYAK